MESPLPPSYDYTLLVNNRKNNFNMYNDLIKATDDGNKMVKRMIREEMELSAHCRICGNVFKSLDLFLNHKTYYCLERAGNYLGRNHALVCPDPSSHGIQTAEQEEPQYVALEETRYALMLETEVQAQEKDRTEKRQETNTKGKGGKAAHTKRVSRARLIHEMTAPEAAKVTLSPAVPEKTPKQPPTRVWRSRKPQIKLLSPLHSITKRLSVKATSTQETDDDEEEIDEQSSGSDTPLEDLGADSQTPASEENSAVSADEDSTSGGDSAECKIVDLSLAEEEGTSESGNRIQDLEQPCSEKAAVLSGLPEGSAGVPCVEVLSASSEDDRSAFGTESAMEMDCPKLSPYSVDSGSMEMEHDVGVEALPPMQAAGETRAAQPSRSTSASRVAPGHAGSSQPVMQKTRTSTRERKTPKWMLDHEDEAKAKASIANRKRSAPTDSTEAKEGDASTKRRRKVRPDDQHSYAKPAHMKTSPVKVTKIQRLPCGDCTMTFANRKSLTFHMKQQHGGQRTISYCHLCHRVYQYAWGLKRHLQRTHHLSDEQVRDLKGLDAEDIAKLRRKFQPRPNPRVIPAAQESAGPSSTVLPKTEVSCSSVEPAKAAAPQTAETPAPGPGKAEPQKPKAEVPTIEAESPSRIECKYCGRLFAREASYENHLRMRHANELSPHSKKALAVTTVADRLFQRICPKPASSSGSPSQQSSATTSSSGSSKMGEAPKKNNKPGWGGSRTSLAKKSGGAAKVLSNPGPDSLAKYQLINMSAEQPATPGSVTSGQMSEAGNPGLSQTEKSTRAEGKDVPPVLFTASPASTETLRAVVNRRGRKAPGPASHPANWNKPAASGDDSQSSPVMVKINQALPTAAIEHIVVEPGRKQLELIWIGKQPGKPSEKVNSKKYLVVEDPPQPKAPDTSEVDKMANSKGDKGALQGVRTRQSSPAGRACPTPNTSSSSSTPSPLSTSTTTAATVSTSTTPAPTSTDSQSQAL